MSIDARNYYNDPRTFGPASETVTVYIDDERVELPTKFEVCPVCDGRGTHVNPSIDAGGLSASEFHEDPEFEELYFGGAYDVQCNRCGGKRVVAVADYEALTSEQREALEIQQRADAEYAAECRAELALGC